MINYEKFKDNAYGIDISCDNTSEYTISFIYNGVDFVIKADSVDWIKEVLNTCAKSDSNIDNCLKTILDKAQELGYKYYSYGLD